MQKKSDLLDKILSLKFKPGERDMRWNTSGGEVEPKVGFSPKGWGSLFEAGATTERFISEDEENKLKKLKLGLIPYKYIANVPYFRAVPPPKEFKYRTILNNKTGLVREISFLQRLPKEILEHEMKPIQEELKGMVPVKLSSQIIGIGDFSDFVFMGNLALKTIPSLAEDMVYRELAYYNCNEKCPKNIKQKIISYWIDFQISLSQLFYKTFCEAALSHKNLNHETKGLIELVSPLK